jgi:ABC-type multidrug transport system fused ATPase/permease subunit
MSRVKKIISLIPLEYKKKIPFLILLIIFTTFLEIVGLSMVIPVVSLLLKKQFVFLGYEFISEKILIYALIFLFLIYFFKTLFLVFFNYWKSKFIYGMHKRISTDLYYKYINQNYLFFTKRNSSDLIRNLINLEPFVRNIEATFVLIAEIILVFFLLIILLFYKPIVIISIGTIALIVSYFFFTND